MPFEEQKTSDMSLENIKVETDTEPTEGPCNGDTEYGYDGDIEQVLFFVIWDR